MLRRGRHGPVLKQVPQMLLAGLAVDPNNTDLLANLQTTYAWLAGQPGGDVGETGALATGVVRVNANLRAGPSTDAPVVGLAPRGSRIRVTGIDASGHWLRVDRGAEPDAFVAARLVQDLEPSGLQCGRDIALEICAALRAGAQDARSSRSCRSCSARSRMRKQGPAEQSHHASPRPASPRLRSTHVSWKSSSCATRSVS